MELWYNPEDEDHRNWLENFGKKKSDNVNDNRADNFFGLKKIPVVEVTVPDCSFQDTYPEWINPVTGEETGEQIVDINCEAHLGLYYFETRAQYEDWKKNTLDKLAPQVESPDGEMVELPKDMLPDRPTWEAKDEIEEEG